MVLPQHGAVSIDIYRIGGTRMKEKKDPTTLEAFFSLSFFYFSFSVTRAFSLSIKGEAGHHKEGGDLNARTRHEHTAERRASSQHHSLIPPETWDPLPLSPVCNPYYKPSVGNTSSSELDIGTLRPNQYKPLCPPSTPSKPDAQIQIYSSVVENINSWRTR